MDPDGKSDWKADLKYAGRETLQTFNGDFGADFMLEAENDFAEGRYFNAAIHFLDACAEAFFDIWCPYRKLAGFNKGLAGSVTSGLSTAGSATSSTSKVIVNLADKTNSMSHMFSLDHLKGGIMELGKTQEEIFGKVLSIIQNIDITKLKEGSNELRTLINGVEATIRFFVRDGEVINVDAFRNYSERVLGNLIE